MPHTDNLRLTKNTILHSLMFRGVLRLASCSAAFLPQQRVTAVPYPSLAGKVRTEPLSFVSCYTATRRLSGKMAAPAQADAFSGREWKDGEAHEVLPKVFLGSMVSCASAHDRQTSFTHGGGSLLEHLGARKLLLGLLRVVPPRSGPPSDPAAAVH